MAVRRTTVLVVVAALGCVLVTCGFALLAGGIGGEHDARTVAGILLGLAGLVCFRILHWVRRVRLMTQAGLALHVGEDDGEGRPGAGDGG